MQFLVEFLEPMSLDHHKKLNEVFLPTIWNTVFRENFAPVLFSPFSPSDPEGEFKTGLIELDI